MVGTSINQRGLAVKMRSSFLATLTLLFTAACSGSPVGWGSDDNAGDSAPTDDGGSSNDAATSNDTGATKDATVGNDTGTVDAGIDTGTVTVTVDNSDGFGAARQACIDEINKLRVAAGHAKYTIWDPPAIDTCVDEQATYDQKANSAHDAWISGVYPSCNGNAQDECLGYGNDPSAVVACLDSMWDERLQSNCSTCDSCNSSTLSQSVLDCQNTSTCDFYGNYGGECGHYVNMSADYFTQAACGFSTVGSSTDWAVQNFQ